MNIAYLKALRPLGLAAVIVLVLSLLPSPTPAVAVPLDTASPAPLQASTIIAQIQASSDDAEQNVTTGTLSLESPGLSLGESALSFPQYVGLRFTNITVPPGATINQAFLSFTASGNWSGPNTVSITGHDVGDSPTFSSGDGPVNRQADFTSAQTTWVLEDWDDEGVYQSPGLASIIQEIVNRSDWTDGNALSLIIQDDGGLDVIRRQAVAFDGDPAHAARLTIILETSLNTTLFLETQREGPLPDLVVTNIHSDQAGYQAGTNWQAVIEVTNVGGEEAGHFAVTGRIGRIREGELSVSWAPVHVFGEINGLAPGQSETITSPPYDFSDLPPDPLPTSYTSWEAGLPDRGQVLLLADADVNINPADNTFFQEVEEGDETNNGAVATFIYPSVPDNVVYDPTLDGDGDGQYPPEDCNDSDPTIYTGAPEIPADGIDQDCSAGDLPCTTVILCPPGWDSPADNPHPDPFNADLDNDGYTYIEGDCNDMNPSIHPGQAEAPNNLDDDCDRLVDEGWTSADPDSLDLDNDGFSVHDGDCDDLQSMINPDAPEIDDGIDNDCDGVIDEWIATPDWVISDFIVERNHSDCNDYFSRPETWDFGDVCGLVFHFWIENQGEDLGTLAPGLVHNTVRVTDLVDQYPITNYEEGPGSVYIPYHEFSTASMVDLMACGPMGFLAYIPSSAAGGLLGEENTGNNWAVAYLEVDETISETGSDLDILFGVHPAYGNLHIVYPYQDADDYGLLVQPVGIAEGSCPPPVLIDFTTRVRVLHNGALIYEQEKAEPASGLNSFITQFAARPGNGDEIVIEIQLNSDGSVLEDTSNNDCVLTFSYDRATYRRNDELVLENVQGCSYGGIGAVGGALGGVSGNVGIVLAGALVFGVLGAGLGWGLAPRLGISSKIGLATIALAGAAGGVLAGGGIAALGVVILSGQATETDSAVANLPDLFQETISDGPVFCSQYVDSSVSVGLDDQGGINDILLQLQPNDVKLPENGRYLITLWDDQGSQEALITQEQSVSLVSTRLAANLGEHILWQVEVEAPASPGGDLYVRSCLPEVQVFSLASYLEAAETDAILIPLNPIQEGASVFGGCDPDDPDCHAWARLEFGENQAFIVFEVGVSADHPSAANGTLQTDFALSRSDAPALTLSQEESVRDMEPVVGTVQFDGQDFTGYTLRIAVPEGVFGAFSLDGDVKLVGEGGEELGKGRVMAEELDTGAVPTPTFTPFIPTPTFTPIPPQDTSPPKVGSINASPNPALTTSPVTVSANITDTSGVASVILYYRTGKGGYTQAGAMKPGGGNTYALNLGTLTPAGTYDFRILATDALGNATCGVKNLAACPGGSFTVNIP